ncbi:MAG: N-acetylmuramoyl-L-alanine amidase-like domain-containing protein [Mariniphaga sp.]
MRLVFYFFLLLLFTQCSGIEKMNLDTYSTSFDEDSRILESVLVQLTEEEQTPTGELMVKVGHLFLETPYVASTLETEGDERLIINLREMDCTTFAETCLALTRTIKSKKTGLDRFAQELASVRYRDARIKGYTSRLHYTTDWIYNNQQKHLIKDVTGEIINIPYKKTINFMSTHPDSYMHLKSNAAYVAEMAAIENDISQRDYYYIPKERIANVESQLQDGDIVAFTTNIEGLDVSHMGVLVRKNNRIHLMHASLSAKKVELTEEPLADYLKDSKTVTGIMVARPL